MDVMENTMTKPLDNSEIHHLYDCEICGALHRWEFSGDCRQDSERFPDEQAYVRKNGISLECVAVWPMSDRIASDTGAPEPWRRVRAPDFHQEATT